MRALGKRLNNLKRRRPQAILHRTAPGSGGSHPHARTMDLFYSTGMGSFWCTGTYRRVPGRCSSLSPYRTDRVVCVDCLVTCWGWPTAALATACPWAWACPLDEGQPGGHSQRRPRDGPQHRRAAARWEASPQASVYPEQRRATRDLLRRRWHLTRTRAALLPPCSRPTGRTPCLSSGRRAPTKPTATGSPRGCPLRQCTSVGKSTSP